jgi:hypothetical protein
MPSSRNEARRLSCRLTTRLEYTAERLIFQETFAYTSRVSASSCGSTTLDELASLASRYDFWCDTGREPGRPKSSVRKRVCFRTLLASTTLLFKKGEESGK